MTLIFSFFFNARSCSFCTSDSMFLSYIFNFFLHGFNLIFWVFFWTITWFSTCIFTGFLLQFWVIIRITFWTVIRNQNRCWRALVTANLFKYYNINKFLRKIYVIGKWSRLTENQFSTNNIFYENIQVEGSC